MKVLIVDDHALFRVGLQGLLERRGLHSQYHQTKPIGTWSQPMQGYRPGRGGDAVCRRCVVFLHGFAPWLRSSCPRDRDRRPALLLLLHLARAAEGEAAGGTGCSR